jgi:hypothetical protein
MNPISVFATTGAPASFDSTVMHTLMLAAQGSSLQVSLDGKPLTFTQNGAAVTTVTLPVSNGTNNGAVGISFGSADNRGLAGGQRASNLAISSYAPIGP